MVSLKYVPEVLDVIEKWVPDRGTRSALLTDLYRTKAFTKNKSFRETINALLELHAWRHLRPTTPKP